MQLIFISYKNKPVFLVNISKWRGLSVNDIRFSVRQDLITSVLHLFSYYDVYIHIYYNNLKCQVDIMIQFNILLSCSKSFNRFSISANRGTKTTHL